MGEIPLTQGKVAILAPHEPGEQMDSSQLVVCRFCGAVKPTIGTWTTMCLRTIHAHAWWR